MKANKNYNLFVGDPNYKMNNYLTFQSPFTSNRFTNDTMQRNLFYIRSAVIGSLIYTIICAHSINKILFTLSITAHVYSYLHLKLKLSTLKLRTCFSLICVAYKIALLEKIELFSLLTYNFPSLAADALLIMSWKTHAITELIENMITLVVWKILVCKPLQFSIVQLILSTVISTTLSGFIERYYKESWVLLDTFRKGYKMYTDLIDFIPNSLIILNQKGEICYDSHPNIIFFTSEAKQQRKLNKLKPKQLFTNAVQVEDLPLFEDSFKKVLKGDNVNIRIRFKVVPGVYNWYLIKMDKINWKTNGCVAVFCYNIERDQASIDKLIQFMEDKKEEVNNVYYNLEKLFTNQAVSKKQTIISMCKALFFYDASDAYLRYLHGSFKADEASFEIQNLVSLTVEVMINYAFENNSKVFLKFEPSFPTEASGERNKFKNILLSLNSYVFRNCKSSDIRITCRLSESIEKDRILLSFEYMFTTTDVNFEKYIAAIRKPLVLNDILKFGISDSVFPFLLSELKGTLEINNDGNSIKLAIKY